MFQAQLFSVLCRNHNKYKDYCNFPEFYNKWIVLFKFILYQDKGNNNFIKISETVSLYKSVLWKSKVSDKMRILKHWTKLAQRIGQMWAAG
jgi:hypothetical protein